jgi:hypothetical protein
MLPALEATAAGNTGAAVGAENDLCQRIADTMVRVAPWLS